MAGFIKYSKVNTYDYVTITSSNASFEIENNNTTKIQITNHSNTVINLSVNNQSHIILPLSEFVIEDFNVIKTITFLTFNVLVSITALSGG